MATRASGAGSDSFRNPNRRRLSAVAAVGASRSLLLWCRPPQSDLWDSVTANEWGVDATYLDAADQDQSLH
jgi:hypothetical protein